MLPQSEKGLSYYSRMTKRKMLSCLWWTTTTTFLCSVDALQTGSSNCFLQRAKVTLCNPHAQSMKRRQVSNDMLCPHRTSFCLQGNEASFSNNKYCQKSTSRICMIRDNKVEVNDQTKSNKEETRIDPSAEEDTSHFANENAMLIEEVDSNISAKNQNIAKEQERKVDNFGGSSEANWPEPFQNVYPWVKQNIFLGIEPKPEIIAIMTIYFVEGALGLARLAQTFYLKDTLHLGPAELSALTGLFTIPWTIKPLYGFLSDGLPLFGYKRRSYLILAGLVGFLSYTALGNEFWGIFDTMGVGLISGTVAAFIVSSACIACSDVVADGIVVQRTRDSDDPSMAGGLQSLCWGSAALGGLISAYFSGSLLEIMGAQEVFSLTSFLPLLVALIALSIDEQRITEHDEQTQINIQDEKAKAINANSADQITSDIESEGLKSQIQSLWSAIKEPAVWKPALFLFLWQSTPTSEGAFLYFMTNDLGFGPEFLGRVRLVTAFSGLVGVWAYQKFLRKIAIKDILFWTSIASTPLGLSQVLLITHANRALGIPDAAFVFGDDVALSILGELAFLPTLVLAARICPPGVEATLFATLMSIFNGASVVGTEVGAFLTKAMGVTESNFDNLAMLTVLCNVSSLYPLIFINLLNGIGSQSEDDIEVEEGKEHNILDVASVPHEGLLEGDSER